MEEEKGRQWLGHRTNGHKGGGGGRLGWDWPGAGLEADWINWSWKGCLGKGTVGWVGFIACCCCCWVLAISTTAEWPGRAWTNRGKWDGARILILIWTVLGCWEVARRSWKGQQQQWTIECGTEWDGREWSCWGAAFLLLLTPVHSPPLPKKDVDEEWMDIGHGQGMERNIWGTKWDWLTSHSRGQENGIEMPPAAGGPSNVNQRGGGRWTQMGKRKNTELNGIRRKSGEEEGKVSLEESKNFFIFCRHFPPKANERKAGACQSTRNGLHFSYNSFFQLHF
jgi:hypothetical protein